MLWGSETRCGVLAWAPRVLERWSVMDARRMLLLSILCRLVHGLLGLTVVLARRGLRKDVELLWGS